MSTSPGQSETRTNPIRAIRQYPLLIIAFMVGFAILGAAIASTWPSVYEATAGLVVEDARTSQLFGDTRAADPRRYVADQVAILQSRVVAEGANEAAAESDPPQSISTYAFLTDASFSYSDDTNFVTISFTASKPAIAQGGANALAASYEGIVAGRLDSDAQTAIDELDEAIDEVVVNIATLQEEIEALGINNGGSAQTDEELAEIVRELSEIRSVDSADAPEETKAIAERLAAELNARQLVADVESRLPATAFLLRQQEDALGLLSELTLRRSQVEVDARLAGNGVAVFSPAGPGKLQGVSTRTAVVLSIVLGALVGGGIAYWLSQRRRRFEDRFEPQAVLGVPMLAGIPASSSAWQRSVSGALRFIDSKDDDDATPSDMLPVISAPTSAAAEAFRVLVGALQYQLTESGVMPAGTTGTAGDSSPGAVVAVSSPASNEGKTFVASNLAVAAARVGLRVLLVDGDFGAQQTSVLFSDSGQAGIDVGLTELVRRLADLQDVIVTVDVGDDLHLDLLGRGHVEIPAADLFGSQALADTFGRLAEAYDLVILDTPPLLEVAYANTAVQQVDSVLAVVAHRSRVEKLEELRYRLELIGVPMLGYVYTSIPARRQTQVRAGRSDDVLGTAGTGSDEESAKTT